MMRVIAILFLLAGCTPADRLVSYDYVWYNYPTTLEICDTLRVDTERVIEHANWWNSDIGDSYPFFAEDSIFFSDCLQPPEPSTVRVQKINTNEMFFGDDYTIATARARASLVSQLFEDSPGSYYRREYIESCTVYIGKLNTDWVIRHEFGHCWGWNHTHRDRWTHLMSPLVGHDVEGLELMPHEEWVNWEL